MGTAGRVCSICPRPHVSCNCQATLLFLSCTFPCAGIVCRFAGLMHIVIATSQPSCIHQCTVTVEHPHLPKAKFGIKNNHLVVWLNSTGNYGCRSQTPQCLHLFNDDRTNYKLHYTYFEHTVDLLLILVRSAIQSHLISWSFQNLSKHALNVLTVFTSTTEFPKLCQILTVRNRLFIITKAFIAVILSSFMQKNHFLYSLSMLDQSCH